jgi:hypothetical protein
LAHCGTIFESVVRLAIVIAPLSCFL